MMAKRTPQERVDWLIADAVERYHLLYDLYDRVIVMHSGGKDSCVLTECAAICGRERGIKPEVWFFDWEIIPEPAVRFLESQAARTDIAWKWWALPISQVTSGSTNKMLMTAFDPELPREKWFREPPADAVMEHAALEPWMSTTDFCERAIPDLHCLALGFRENENASRRTIFNRRKIDNKELHWISGTRKAYPLSDWTNDEIWGAIHDKGWAWNPAYLRMWQSGRNKSELRWGSFFHTEGQATVSNIVREWPEMWNRLLELDRIPGIENLARYHRTGFFGTGADRLRGMRDPVEIRKMLREILHLASPASREQIIDQLSQLIQVAVRNRGELPWTRMVRLAMKNFSLGDPPRVHPGPTASATTYINEGFLRKGRPKRAGRASIRARGWLYMMREQKEGEDGER